MANKPLFNPPFGRRPPAVQNKTGLPTVAESRGIATAHAPETQQGLLRTEINTYFTKPTQSRLLYNGDRLWARVTMLLETAGPVAYGNSAQLEPILSGRGTLLQTNIPTTVVIGKGTQLYIASTSVNRVSVTIEPVPWAEQILAATTNVVQAIVDLGRAIVAGKR